MGDSKSVEVEAIGIFWLLLRAGSYLDLNETYLVPLFRRNLVSISILDKFGFLVYLEMTDRKSVV